MASNKRTIVSLEFEQADLPMLMHALAIARNTALMCGHDAAKRRLESYRKQVEALIPKPALAFDGEVWSEIGMAVAEGNPWSVRFEAKRYSWEAGRDTGSIVVRVGDREWTSESWSHTQESGAVEAVREVLRDLAPLSAECLDDAPGCTPG